MDTDTARSGLQLRSLVKADGELEISLVSRPVPSPATDEVVIRIEAAPINPSDIGLLFAAADMSTATATGSPTEPVITARIPERSMKGMAGRVGHALPVGNEGAGIVVEAGSATGAQALLGKAVAVMSGAMYAQYRCVKADQCLVLPDGVRPAQGASCFVNPLTALGMVETMRLEGHKALVHSPAASNLGQMLNRICIKDGIGLVNIVRRADQVQLLRAKGASHVVNSGSPTFLEDLTQAIAATGATLAFDAIGGGKLAGQILGCMEATLQRNAKEYSRYGSNTYKQVYLYGAMDPGPTEFSRNFGTAWGMGGWLVFNFLQRIGPQATLALKQRVAAELTTIFASSYAKEVSLAEALSLEAIAVYGQRTTGGKYLINPNKGLTGYA